MDNSFQMQTEMIKISMQIERWTRLVKAFFQIEHFKSWSNQTSTKDWHKATE